MGEGGRLIQREGLSEELGFRSGEMKHESSRSGAGEAPPEKGIPGRENSRHEGAPSGKESGKVENLKGQCGQSEFWLMRRRMRLVG